MSERTLAFVQARVGSSRLPGKTLADVTGEPAMVRVVDRVARAGGIDGVAVLTSDSERDAPLRELGGTIGVHVIAGSEHDVLDRFADGISELDPTRIVRITADCPLADPGVIADLIALFDGTPGCQYAAVATGAMPSAPGLNRYPDGLDAEVISVGALLLAAENARDQYEREHVTPYIWRRPSEFESAMLQAPTDLGGERWTVDFPEDLEFVRAIYERLGPDNEFGLAEILALLEREPALRDINAARDSNERIED